MSTSLIALAALAALCLTVLSICMAVAKPEEELWPDGVDSSDGSSRVVTAGKNSSRHH